MICDLYLDKSAFKKEKLEELSIHSGLLIPKGNIKAEI